MTDVQQVQDPAGERSEKFCPSPLEPEGGHAGGRAAGGCDEDSVALWQAALNATTSGIVITDSAGVVRWLNPVFSRLTGYTADEAVGRTPRLLKSGWHSAAFYRDLWDTVLSGGAGHGEVVNRRKDGNTYTEEQTITLVRSTYTEEPKAPERKRRKP
jgi:PAS domain S-box-containing protein